MVEVDQRAEEGDFDGRGERLARENLLLAPQGPLQTFLHWEAMDMFSFVDLKRHIAGWVLT